MERGEQGIKRSGLNRKSLLIEALKMVFKSISVISWLWTLCSKLTAVIVCNGQYQFLLRPCCLSWRILVLPSLTPKTRSFCSVMYKDQLLQSLWQISPLSGKPAGLFALRYAAIKHYFQICNFLSPCQSTWASPPQTQSLL